MSFYSGSRTSELRLILGRLVRDFARDYFRDLSRNLFVEPVWWRKFALDGPTRWCERCRTFYDGHRCPFCRVHGRRLVMESPVARARSLRRRAVQRLAA